LADSGKSWTAQSGKPSATGHYPLFAQLYKSGGIGNPDGILWGWLQFTGDQNGVAGTLYWSRPSGITSLNGGGTVLTYSAGFTNQAPIIASTYHNTAVPLNWTGDGMDFLYDGARPGVTNIMHQTTSVKLEPVVSVQYPLPLGKTYTLHISQNTGLVTGTFPDPNDKKTPQISGVALQNQAVAAVFFWNTNAGAFLLEQP
jgi:hypothetical protein